MTADESERFAAILAEHPTLAIASERDGQPYVASVFFAEEFAPDGSLSLYCSVIQGSTKLENLRRNPRVAFAVSPSLPTRWVQGIATAQILTDPAEARRALDLIVARSPAARDFIDRLPVSAVRLSVRSVKLTDITGPRPYRAAVNFPQGSP